MDSRPDPDDVDVRVDIDDDDDYVEQNGGVSREHRNGIKEQRGSTTTHQHWSKNQTI